MRLKVDENLPRAACDLLSRAGHDAIGVSEQGLSGAADARIYQLCQDEQRALITLDADLANVQAYDSKSSSGVIVLRLERTGSECSMPWRARCRCWNASRWPSGCGWSRRTE